MLDGLVGGAVLAHADGIVREHVHHVEAHQGGHAHGVLHVIAKHEEGGAIGAQAAVQLQAVANGGHGMLAHAKVQVRAGGVLGGEIAAALHFGLVRGGQVGAAADQVRHARGQAVDDLAAGIAGGGLLVKGPIGLVVQQVHGQFFAVPRLVFLVEIRVRGLVFVHQAQPGLARLFAAGRGFRRAGVHVFRHGEGRVVPAQGLLGFRQGLVAQRFAVRAGLARLGRAKADLRVAHDEGGLIASLGQADGGAHVLVAIAVLYVDHVPAIGAEAGGHVLAEGDVRIALDGDLVVIVQGDQLVELQRAGQRAGLVRDAFHHAAVAQDAIGVVVDHREAFPVEMRGQVFFRHGEAHGVGNALAERAGGGFHADGVLIFRMARRLGAVLTEGLQVVHRQPIAEQVQKRIDQHGAVPAGEHEAVAIVPLGIGVGVHHVLAPHGIGHGGGAHRHAGMAALGLLHALGGEDADCVDDFLVQTHK